MRPIEKINEILKKRSLNKEFMLELKAYTLDLEEMNYAIERLDKENILDKHIMRLMVKNISHATGLSYAFVQFKPSDLSTFQTQIASKAKDAQRIAELLKTLNTIASGEDKFHIDKSVLKSAIAQAEYARDIGYAAQRLNKKGIFNNKILELLFDHGKDADALTTLLLNLEKFNDDENTPKLLNKLKELGRDSTSVINTLNLLFKEGTFSYSQAFKIFDTKEFSKEIHAGFVQLKSKQSSHLLIDANTQALIENPKNAPDLAKCMRELSLAGILPETREMLTSKAPYSKGLFIIFKLFRMVNQLTETTCSICCKHATIFADDKIINAWSNIPPLPILSDSDVSFILTACENSNEDSSDTIVDKIKTYIEDQFRDENPLVNEKLSFK